MASPTSSAGKRRGSMVRQLSLQGGAVRESANSRKSLKKQMSEDGGRTRQSETATSVTSLAWSDRPEAGLRVGSGDGRAGHTTGKTMTRPRPVKVAWADRRQDSLETPTGVEVVARKCQGQPRPVSQRLTNLPLLGDKDTLVYTRQQLAERLRRAWKEREKSKPNLEIFLAHEENSAVDAVGTARSNSEKPDILLQESITSRSETVRVQFDPAAKPEDPKETELIADATKQEQAKIEIHVSPSEYQSKEDAPLKNPALADLLDFKTFPVANASKKFGNNYLNSKFQVRTIDLSSKRCTREQPMKARHSRDKENMGNSAIISMSDSPRSDSSYSECTKMGKMEEEQSPPLTASARRASFRSSNLLNKTIHGSFSSSLHSSSVDIDDVLSSAQRPEIRVVLTKNNAPRPPLTRTLSAPSQQSEEPPQPPQGAAPKTVKPVQPRKIAHPSISMDVSVPNDDDEANALRDRAKSAPTRRKLKTAAARRKNKEKGTDSSEEEKDARDTPTKKTTRRRQMVKGGGDIVTMVSLVSPAASDTEDSVIQVPGESWTAEDKEKDEVTAGPAAVEEQRDATSFIIQKFVSLRKTTKTVSFQQQPPVTRSYSSSFPSRRVPAGAPIIVPAPVILNPALTPAQLQEKKSFGGVNSVYDNRGVKRRLVRTRSLPQKEDDASSDETSKTDTSTEPVSAAHHNRTDSGGGKEARDEEGEEVEEGQNREPEFKTPKERECWTLYRKMLEKGVSVSYDTVLRGMLTPTEYRLRKNHLLSSC